MISSSFFKTNRQRLSEALGGGIVVLSAYTKFQLASDAAHPFRQEPNFWYLSGVEEPDWWLVIDGLRDRSWLVAPERSQTSLIFDGGLDTEEVLRASGVDEVITQMEAKELLAKLSQQHGMVYTLGDEPHARHYDFVVNPALREMKRKLESIFARVQDCRPNLATLRAIKQAEEISAIKRAVKLTNQAFEQVKEKINDYSHEYEIEADFSYHFRRHGADGHAYSPIIGFGKNAITLHYDSNNSRLRKNGLILMDVGARINGYSADITRTYGRGEPTRRQVQVHTEVQQALEQIIRLIKPGNSLADYSRSVDEIMKRAMINLKLIVDSGDEKAYRKYFPHGIGHGLGVDVHDSLGQGDHFLPGMVLTVEPGIYIPEENIGVRIEDDILVTDSGNANLSQALSTDLL